MNELTIEAIENELRQKANANEVADIRIGYDGQVYPMAGDAVRAVGNDVAEVREDIGEKADVNEIVALRTGYNNTVYATAGDAFHALCAVVAQLNQNLSSKANAIEVADIRAGYDGTLYYVAGDAVRALGEDLNTKDSEIRQYIDRKAVDGLIYEDNMLYLTSNGVIISDPVEVIGGSGGGGSANTVLRVNNQNGGTNFTISNGQTMNIMFSFTSTEDGVATGNGTCKLTVNGALKRTFSIPQGTNTIDVTQYLISGANTVKVSCTDTYGSMRSLTYTITVVTLTLESMFDENIVYNGDISLKYTPYGVGISKTTHILVDNVEVTAETTVNSGRQATYVISGLTHGIHTLELYSTASLESETLESNHLKYEIMYAETGNTQPMIALGLVTTSAYQGEMISIPYSIYNPSTLSCEITLKVLNPDNSEYSSQQITVDRARHIWNTRNYPIGNVKFQIVYGDTNRMKTISVSESDINITAVSNDLELYLTSAGRSNSEANPDVWTDGEIETTFDGVNWASTGWIEDINGDVALRLNGGATAEINFLPFENDFKQYGKTLEFEFTVHDVNNRDAEIISCTNGNVGVSITADRAIIRSAMSSVECRFRDEEKIRVSFVVESTSEHRLLLVYLNGIMSGAMQYPSNDIFSQEVPTTISIGSQYCGVDLYTVRSYSTALTSHEVVTNYIADIANIVDKTELYEANDIYNGNVISYEVMKDRIPVITIIGALPQSKGDKKDVTFIYENPNAPTLNFTDVCKLDVQGTSSQFYVVKNFKAKFTSNHTHAVGQLPAKVFCLKADYAEATSTHNTQNANLIDTLYSEPTPAQENDARCRTTVYGFPCVLFHQDTVDSVPVFVGKIYLLTLNSH